MHLVITGLVLINKVAGESTIGGAIPKSCHSNSKYPKGKEGTFRQKREETVDCSPTDQFAKAFIKPLQWKHPKVSSSVELKAKWRSCPLYAEFWQMIGSNVAIYFLTLRCI